MLYDPKKWKTPADPFSLDSLTAWLEKKPRHAWYVKFPITACGITQYLRDCGFADAYRRSGRMSIFGTFGTVFGLGNRWPFETYGAALDRARKLQEEQS